MASENESRKIPLGLKLTPFDEEFRRDPHPRLKDLRELCPVHRDPELDQVVISSEESAREIVRDHNLGVDPRKANPEDSVQQFRPQDDSEPSMLFLDDPDHQRLRKLVAPSFAPKKVEAKRPMIREIAESLVAAITPNHQGEFDLIDGLAGPLPAVAIAKILGIDPQLQNQFKDWSEAASAAFFTGALDPSLQEPGAVAIESLRELFAQEIEQRQGGQADDLIGQMVHAQEDGDRFSKEEILTMCNLLLVAGNVTTSDLIGNGLRALLQHPAQVAMIRQRPEILPNAVEEMLRFDPPVTVTGRITPEVLDIKGVEVRARESMTVMLSAANRDPAVHSEPEQFLIDRSDPQHLSFGGGAHFCVGAHLARIEAQEAIRALLARFPRLELVPGSEEWKQVPGFRGMAKVLLRTVGDS
jgi:cytochrome P450